MKVKKILKTIYVVGIFGLLIAIGIKTFVGKSNSPAKRKSPYRAGDCHMFREGKTERENHGSASAAKR